MSGEITIWLGICTIEELDTVTVESVEAEGELEGQLIKAGLGAPLAQSMINPVPRHAP